MSIEKSSYLLSQEELTIIHDLAGIGTWIWNIDEDSVCWSHTLFQLFEMTPTAELTISSYETIIHPDDREFVLQTIRQALKSEATTYKIKHRILGKNDKIRPVLSYGHISHTHDGVPVRVIGLIQDIAEQEEASVQSAKQPQPELIGNAVRFQRFAEASSEAIVLIEAGVVIDVNDQFIHLYGYEYHEAIGMEGWAFVAPESRELVRSRILANYENPYEALQQKKDGSIFWAQISGKTIAFQDRPIRVTAIQDITERKQVEAIARLRAERNQLFHQVITQSDRDIDGQLHDVLRLGNAQFGTEIGIISHIKSEKYTVQYFDAAGDELQAGSKFDLGDTYCSFTFQGSRNEVVTFDHMGASTHQTHPCYVLFQLEAYIGVSVWVFGERYGTLNFSSPQPKQEPFSESDKEFMVSMAQWVGVALERKQSERQAEQMRLVNQLVSELSEISLEQDIFNLIAKRIPQIVSGERASITLLEQSGDTLVVYALDGVEGAIPTGAVLAAKNTMVGETIKRREPIIVLDVASRDWQDVRALGEMGLKSIIAVPLITSGNLIGTMNVATRQEDAYGPAEIQLMTQVTTLLATTLESRRLFWQMEQRIQHERSVREIADQMRTATSLNDLLQTTAEMLGQHLSADYTVIDLGIDGLPKRDQQKRRQKNVASHEGRVRESDYE